MTHMTLQDMTHEEVIVHRLGRDLGDRLVGHLDVGEMFRSSGLSAGRTTPTNSKYRSEDEERRDQPT